MKKEGVVTGEKSVNSSTECPRRCEGAGVSFRCTARNGGPVGTRIASACPLHSSSLPLWIATVPYRKGVKCSFLPAASRWPPFAVKNQTEGLLKRARTVSRLPNSCHFHGSTVRPINLFIRTDTLASRYACNDGDNLFLQMDLFGLHWTNDRIERSFFFFFFFFWKIWFELKNDWQRQNAPLCESHDYKTPSEFFLLMSPKYHAIHIVVITIDAKSNDTLPKSTRYRRVLINANIHYDYVNEYGRKFENGSHETTTQTGYTKYNIREVSNFTPGKNGLAVAFPETSWSRWTSPTRRELDWVSRKGQGRPGWGGDFSCLDATEHRQ